MKKEFQKVNMLKYFSEMLFCKLINFAKLNMEKLSYNFQKFPF